jgi:hypothetical protein
MKALVQNYLCCATYNATTQPALLYFMSGTAPTTPAGVKALVDLSDMSDLHSKSVGCSLINANYSLDTTTVGQVSVSYTVNTTSAINWSWLKGGYIKNGSWYWLPPSRAYYENGRKSTLYSMPPALFTMPVNAITSSYITPSSSIVKYSDNIGDISASYILEYDQQTTVSAYRCATGYAMVSSNKMATYSQILIYYWSTTTNAWTLAYSQSYAYNTGPLIYSATFAAVTSTKFKVVLNVDPAYWATYMSASSVLANSGFALMHTAAPATLSVPNITWGIIVPMPTPITTGTSLYDFSDNTNSAGNNLYTWSQSSPPDMTNNPAIGRSSYWYGVATANIPAVIDTCSEDPAVGRILITDSKSLTSDAPPSLVAYSYKAGDFL